MPSIDWQTDPSAVIGEFGKRHPNSEAEALLFWAFSSAEALHYLADIDAAYEASRITPGSHLPDVVDVAHVRWATGTCITALDLCAAALARGLGGHPGPKELDIGNFSSAKPTKATKSVIGSMPAPALRWIQELMADSDYDKIKTTRDALTHRRLPRGLHASIGLDGPDPRLDLRVGDRLVPSGRLVEDARDLATRHLENLLALLPEL